MNSSCPKGHPDRRQTTVNRQQRQSYSFGYVQSDMGHKSDPWIENGMAHRLRSRFVPDEISESTGLRPAGLQIFFGKKRQLAKIR